MTPMESMPEFLQYLMNFISPTPHFVVFAQDVLYRGADFSIVWPEIAAMSHRQCLLWFCLAPLSPRYFRG